MNTKRRIQKVVFWICVAIAIVSFFYLVTAFTPWSIPAFVLSLIGTGVFAEIGDGFEPHQPAF